MKFRLKEKAGGHVEGNKQYEAGDIIETDRDLIARFKGKFEKVHEDDLEDTGAPLQTKPNIPSPKAKRGKGSKDKSSQSPSDSDVEITNLNDIEESEHGVEVTSNFPTAKKVKVQVWEKDGWYMVTDPEDDNEVLNEKKLRENQIEEFVHQYEE